ncbi:hypothetical protein ABB34_04545 [Stenotrophomonas daejeonensis]|uniref:Transmembrane protein n=1 Tax=Stenotrophomonas daejeonensis TaxID=659018 RepID=A0A0R0EB03_9GAMM|nr:hypothetical protein [Stenotrophomonas daejeonensis]KRG87523.1 hypothetical protein ABB34_04545 [Stenotrophomonas daejeonensis]
MNPLPPPRSAAAAFVDVTAKLSLLMAGLSVLWCLLQLLLATLLDQFDPVGWLQRQYLPVPPALEWALHHALSLSLAMLLLALAFAAVSWALLRHRGWGRRGFIVFLVAVAVANFAMLPLLDGMFDAMQAMLPADFLATAQGREAMLQMRSGRWVALASAGITALAFAALHGWLVLRLCRPDVRALFR